MKVIEKIDINGKKFKLFQPENEEDVKKLQEMAERGELDDYESFGDKRDKLPPEVEEEGTE